MESLGQYVHQEPADELVGGPLSRTRLSRAPRW
jgi:hypothetical protein